MKDLLLCVHLVAKALILEFSRCNLADYVKELYLSACRTCSTIIFSHSTNHISCHFWRHRRPLRFLNALIWSFGNDDGNDKKNNHLKINMCTVVTISRLSHLVGILDCWRSTLQMDWCARR